FLNDRILLDLAYYRHTCDNQLLLINTPLLTGFDHVVSNFPGKVENKGYEFILKADIIKKEDFKINLGFSYVMNRNKLIAYPDFEKSSFRSTMDLGKSLNLRKKLKFLSVDPQTGLYIFEDLNKDGVITSNISNLNDDKYA